MKFKSEVIVLAVVICILFGISTVCASDNNTGTISIDDNIQDIASTDNYQKVDVSSEPSNYSIAKFKDDLIKSNGTFNMNHDYVFGENDSEVSFELDARGVIGDTDLSDERIHLQDAIVILGGINNNRELVKQAILKCGAVSVQNVLDGTV